jgi:hypothetical protein
MNNDCLAQARLIFGGDVTNIRLTRVLDTLPPPTL